MGILVSFIARHHPLGIIPAAILFGGLSAASSPLQKNLYLPDASVQVFAGTIFVMILTFETLYGRFRVFQPKFPELPDTGGLPHIAPRPAKETVAS
jgi:simple sugar transport system permease protein